MTEQTQKPSPGRIVLYRETDNEEENPAIITKVWSESCVNLRVFADDDHPMRRRTSVLHENTGGPSWRWPPRV